MRGFSLGLGDVVSPLWIGVILVAANPRGAPIAGLTLHPTDYESLSKPLDQMKVWYLG